MLVNNAGITRDTTMKRMDHAKWQDVIDTNLGGCFNMAKAVFEGMQSRGYGRIVNIGSINGQAGQYGQVNYAAAKSGIHGFTKALAQEGARNGVTVNAIAPGYIDTDMVAAVPPEVLGKIVAKIPVNRLGKAERDRARRGVPGRRGCRLRHRIDAVDQRRAAYVLRMEVRHAHQAVGDDRRARDLDQPRADVLGGAGSGGGASGTAAQRPGRGDRCRAARRARRRPI